MMWRYHSLAIVSEFSCVWAKTVIRRIPHNNVFFKGFIKETLILQRPCLKLDGGQGVRPAEPLGFRRKH